MTSPARFIRSEETERLTAVGQMVRMTSADGLVKRNFIPRRDFVKLPGSAPHIYKEIMRQIYFKKQMLGKWRRDDGESKKLVSEETMHREVQKLINDGWSLETHGMFHLRGMTLTKT